jgi:hypothetical protein
MFRVRFCFDVLSSRVTIQASRLAQPEKRVYIEVQSSSGRLIRVPATFLGAAISVKVAEQAQYG